MYIVGLIIFIILIICYRESQKHYEDFYVNNTTTSSMLNYLGLNTTHYDDNAKDHYFYNNPPVSDINNLGVNHGGRYCTDNKIKILRQQPIISYEPCNQMASNVNSFFRANTNKIVQYYRKQLINSQRNYEKMIDTSIKNELIKIGKRYGELQNEIDFAEKFLEENKVNTQKYKKYNKKLDEDIQETHQTKNKEVNKSIIHKESYDEFKKKIKFLHKILKYIIGGLAILTIFYLFQKNVENNNNNVISSM
jgi:hypothetical protein